MQAVIERVAGPRPRLLDVGCGAGTDLAHWLAIGWPTEGLAGVDLVEGRIAAARNRCPGVDLRVTDGSELPFETGRFDVATAVTVFSSIFDPDLRKAVFDEMNRVVRPGGSVIVYDFVVRNPRNPDVVAIGGRELRALGPQPSESASMTPLIQAVAAGALIGSWAADAAMKVAPKTHRLTRWQVPDRVRA